MKRNYQIGDTWVCVKDGKRAFIEFNSVHGKVEVWMYGYSWSDGSGYKSDWATSYAMAKRNHWVAGRFKRVKQ